MQTIIALMSRGMHLQITFAKPPMKFSFDDGRKTLQNIYPVDDFLKNIGPDNWQGVWDGKNGMDGHWGKGLSIMTKRNGHIWTYFREHLLMS